MRRLDKFIEVLFLKDAGSLVLQTGAPAWLEMQAGVRQGVMQRALTTAHIISAIAELMPAYEAQGFSGGEDHEFNYKSPSGEVQVRFTPDGEGVRAELRPAPLLEDVEEVGEADGPDPVATRSAAIAVSRKAPPAQAARDGAPGPMMAVGEGPSDPAEAMSALLQLCEERGASDLHLTSGRPPALRIDGDVVVLEGWGAPSDERLTGMLWSITPQRMREQWVATKDADFAHETPQARFRVNLFCDRSGIASVMRKIPAKVFSAEEMGVSKDLLDLCFLPKGLILVTGPTGSGKSTTLAAMIDHINRSRDDNIITIEDPIEFVHVPKRCQIHQREVGTHTGSFKAALRAALREDPDVVLVGEMRDLETVSIAIETAETGHLVFGTLHTNTAPSTVDRIIDQFPADRQAQVRMMLAESLKAVVTQTLCKKVGGGRVAAREVLIANSAVSNLIREGKTYQLASTMQTGRGQGMQTLNDALLELVRKKLIVPEEALSRSLAKAELRKSLEAGGLVASQRVEAPS